MKGFDAIESHESFGTAMEKLGKCNSLKVKQSFKFWEAVSQGCCEQLNTYRVFDASDDSEIMVLREDATCFQRCCCSPEHTFSMGMLGADEDQNAMDKDIKNWDRPRLMEREGCCSKLLCCFSCTDTCANHADVLVTGSEEAGDLYADYHFKEKLCNGCSPQIVIYQGETPVAIIEGPTIFGGCSELCMSYDYTVSTIDAGTLQNTGAPGDICTVVKKKPDCNPCALCLEAFTDSDNFELEFNPNSKFNDVKFKTVCIAALVYIDFMFFEFDNGMCEPVEGGCRLTFFACYVAGCICPCSFTFKNNGEGGE